MIRAGSVARRASTAWVLGVMFAVGCAGVSQDTPRKARRKARREAEPEPEVEEDIEEPPAHAAAAWWNTFFAEFNAGEFELVASRFIENPPARTIGMPTPDQPSREALVAGWQQARTMLPDNKMMAERVLVHDNVAFAHIVSTGTHTGDVPGLAASGQPVGWISLFRLEFDDEGRASDLRIYTNPMAFAAQIGATRGAPKIGLPTLPQNESVPVLADPGETANNGIVKAWYASFGEGWESAQSAIDETFAPSVVFHATHLGEDPQGLEWARAHFEEELSRTAEHDQSNLELHAVGDYVVVTGMWSALVTRRIPRVGGRGKTWKADFADVFRFDEDRKIVEVWWYRNPAQILDQLYEEQSVE